MQKNIENHSLEARNKNQNADQVGNNQVGANQTSNNKTNNKVDDQANNATKYYTMMEVCREATMSYQTLKFYCNKGLVPNVKRDKNNRRIFDKHDMEWVKSLKCLKNCGLTINEMLEYLDLCLQGQQSIPERKIMLAKKRENLEVELRQIQDSIDYIDWKQTFYDDVLAGRTKYFSNSLPAQN